MSATSSTLRAIGPTVSRVGHEREHALRRDEPPLRLQPDDLARRRRKSDRAAGVRAERELAEAGCERGRRAARRAAGRLPGMRGVVARSVPLAVAEHAPRELGQVRLADHDRTGVEQTLDGDRGAIGNVLGIEARAVRRAHAGGVEEILDRERPARERPGRRPPGSTRVMNAFQGSALTGRGRRTRSRPWLRRRRGEAPRRACSQAASRRRPPVARG